MAAADSIFDSVITLMFAESSDKADYKAGFLGNLNIVLSECFDINNAYRELRGKQPLLEPPVITDTAQDVDYERELTRSVIPYGVAGILYTDDDETGISNVYREKYEKALSEQSVFIPQAVKEVWYHG